LDLKATKLDALLNEPMLFNGNTFGSLLLIRLDVDADNFKDDLRIYSLAFPIFLSDSLKAFYSVASFWKLFLHLFILLSSMSPINSYFSKMVSSSLSSSFKELHWAGVSNRQGTAVGFFSLKLEN